MSTRLDGSNVLIQTTSHFGFGATGEGATEVSTGPRIINAANLAAVNGTITAPQGSLALLDDGTLAQNTDGAKTWVQTVANANALSTTIADPGDTKAISVTTSGTCLLTSGGVETRTIAAPTFVGQTIFLYHEVDGGSVEVTSATAINEAGKTKMTFTDVGEAILLIGAERGAALTWSAIANDGVTLA